MVIIIKKFKRIRSGEFTQTQTEIVSRNASDMVIFPDGSVSIAGQVKGSSFTGSVPVNPEDLEVLNFI